MQSVSGAGYPGVPSLDILGNVVPFIGGEEEKMERESRKILGALKNGTVEAAPFTVSAQCNRVATVEGHVEVVSAGLGRRVTAEEVIGALREFRGPEIVRGLPSSPAAPVEVDLRPDRPQPRLDLERGRGMTVTVGRVRPCPLLDVRFVLLSHNTIRGAAGAAVQIAEPAGGGGAARVIVCKFGGTSVQDAQAIQRLIGIIGGRVAERPLVVVSALAGVTDALLGLVRLAEMGGSGFRDRLGELVARHDVVAQQLPGASDAMAAIRADAEILAGELESLAGRRATPRQRDAITGRGEIWSSRIIACALSGADLGAEWVDVRSIMVTDDRFGRATPYTQVLSVRARESFGALLDRSIVPVTQGFIGATPTGIPTTLGRGGSDFSASLFGAALRAKRVEIWTDVDGLMTANHGWCRSRGHWKWRATKRPQEPRPSGPRCFTPPPRCRWFARASRSWCSTPVIRSAAAPSSSPAPM